MPEADWNQVKKISNTMIEDLTPLNQASTPDKQRQLYVSRSRELEDSIVSLKALKPVVDAELANETDN